MEKPWLQFSLHTADRPRISFCANAKRNLHCRKGVAGACEFLTRFCEWTRRQCLLYCRRLHRLANPQPKEPMVPAQPKLSNGKTLAKTIMREIPAAASPSARPRILEGADWQTLLAQVRSVAPEAFDAEGHVLNLKRGEWGF